MIVKLPSLLRHFKRTALFACILTVGSAASFASTLTLAPITPLIVAVASPSFSPVAGTYASAQSVTISTTTGGATIRYTIDGSTPTETNGTVYSSAVSINSSTMLKAIAYESGFTDSPVTSGLYTITTSPAPVVNVLYDFSSANNGGINPESLIQGSDGNFYGMTNSGGSSNDGIVFKMTPSGVLTTLVSFNGSNGKNPVGALTQGSDGNFYGVTNGGGGGSGNFFKITPAGVLTTLVSISNSSNQAFPVTGLVQGRDGNFYGVAPTGTAFGSVFKMTPTGVVTTLTSFNFTNGSEPVAALVQGSDGNFYGTTEFGGSASNGTVFKITPAGVLTSLVSFGANGVSGANPTTALVQGTDGNFYGTTQSTAFKMTPAGVVTTLASLNGSNGAYTSLLQDSDSSIYGMSGGGSFLKGTVLKMTPAGVLTTLFAFDGPDGSVGAGSLVRGSDGNLYGTAGGGVSNVGVFFQLIVPPVAIPVFSPAAGTYTSAQTVTITSATSGASIRYTTDGSTPNETHGILYSGPVSIGGTTTINAIAYETGVTDSPVATASYIINIPGVVQAPTFSPGGGIYASAQSVSMTSATSGATINYTTDGSIPTETHGTPYAGPISVSASTTLSAIAFENGSSDSAVAIAGYTINTPPTYSPVAGTFPSAQTVSISSATSGATIRYTTDGSTPTETNGTVYSGPISITKTTMLKTIAYVPGYFDSPVASSLYSITSSPASVLNVIYNFTGSSDGAYPSANLVQGIDGSLYSTTNAGGSDNEGTVFKTTSAGVLTSMASFNGATGAFPFAGLVQGTDGNFYGTTNTPVFNPSTDDPGTAFKITPGGSLTTLVSFNNNTGIFPFAGLTQGTDGNFYGTTFGAGSSGFGTVFKMTPAGNVTPLVPFAGTNGGFPFAGLVQGSDGNFYGTTFGGGSTFVSATNSGDGTAFKMTPSGTLTTLVSFTGANGLFPAYNLVQGNDGNFYGTTTEDTVNDDGTVFKLTPAGALTTLVYFSSTTGQTPNGLVQGSDGNFYGMTEGTGSGGSYGTIFKITPAGVLTTLVSFDGPNGNQPLAGLVQGSDGNFYGTAQYGGTTFASATSPGYGVIFQLIVPSATAAPVFSPAPGTYTSAQTVIITSATSGASIRYTTNGSTPTETTGTLYSGPVSISGTTTLNAIAFKSGLVDSAVITPNYTIQPATSSSSSTASSGGGGGAFDDWFLGLLAFAGILRSRLGALKRANH